MDHPHKLPFGWHWVKLGEVSQINPRRPRLICDDNIRYYRAAARPSRISGEPPVSPPPVEEQRRIVTHLEAVQEKICALKAVQEETDKELKRLEQAILDKAFRGEL